MNDDHEIRPVKTQKLKATPQQNSEPVPSVEERLDTLGAALETALDPEAKPKDRTDMLAKVRGARNSHATADGKRQE